MKVKRFCSKYLIDLWGCKLLSHNFKIDYFVKKFLLDFDKRYRFFCNAIISNFLKDLLHNDKGLLLFSGNNNNKSLRKFNLFWANFYSYYSASFCKFYGYKFDSFFSNIDLFRLVNFRRLLHHKLKVKLKYGFDVTLKSPNVKFSKFDLKDYELRCLRYFYFYFGKSKFTSLRSIFNDIYYFEHTLYMFIYRLNISYNLFEIKSWICNGKVKVNGIVIRNPFYIMKVGCVLGFIDEFFSCVFSLLKRGVHLLNVPNYVEVDYKTLSFIFYREIRIEEIPRFSLNTRFFDSISDNSFFLRKSGIAKII